MNKFTMRLVWCLAILLLGLTSLASAATVSVRFCFNLDTFYTDYDDGDYWTQGYDVVASGIHAKIFDNSNDSVIFDDWVSNSVSACTPYMSLNTSRSYMIMLFSESKDDNNNIVRVYQGTSGSDLYYQHVDLGYTPIANGSVYYTYEITDWEHESSVLAAASYALRKNPAGLSSNTFPIYAHTPGNVGAYAANGMIWLNQTTKDRKQSTVHEVGHVVGYKRNGNQGAFHNYEDTGGGNCLSTADGHDIDSREWQTAAATEGIAHFYSVMTWNDDTEADCEFKGVDCQGGRNFQVDWLDQCPTPLGNRGNELDWLRFWWHLHRNQSLSVPTVFSIWDEANPHNWTAPSVYKRLRDAAANNGVSNNIWDAWGAYDGVDHGIWP